MSSTGISQGVLHRWPPPPYEGTATDRQYATEVDRCIGTGPTCYYDPRGNPLTFGEGTAEFTARHTDGTHVVGSHVVCENIWVSTVWLGLDHSFSAGADPLIFETMAFWRLPEDEFGPEHVEWVDLKCERYPTWRDAVKGHLRHVKDYRTKLAKGLTIEDINGRPVGPR